MNWVVTVASILPALLVGVVLYAMPWLTRPTIPLGVSIPSTRVGDPVVTGAVGRFRLGVIAVTVVAVVPAFAGAAFSPVVHALLPIVVELAGVLTVYLVSRRAIQRAKIDGDWYRDVPVRLTATVTANRYRAAPAFAWYVAGFVLLAAAVVVGAIVYDKLPDPLPVRWGPDGVADRFAPKGIWSVFGPVLLGMGMVALLFALAASMRRWTIRAVASDSPEVSERIARAQETLLQALLGQIAFVIALVFALTAVNSWLHPSSAAWNVLTVLLLPNFLILVVIVLFVVRYRRAMADARALQTVPAAGRGGASRAGSSTDSARRSEAPDDDRSWKAGSIYVNRADPALLVPKRFGVGWTVNMGHPAGIALAVVTLLVIVGAIVLAVTAGSH